MVNKVTWRVHEIIEKASAAKTKAEKIKILQEHQNNWALKDVLRGTFDDSVQWLLPEGKPPYEPADESSVPSNLLLRPNKVFISPPVLATCYTCFDNSFTNGTLE